MWGNMNPKVKDKWVAALRSGDYIQGHYRLRTYTSNEDTYCCLGVLCDLHSKETGHKWEETCHTHLSYYDSYNILPDNVVEWAGLHSNVPVIDYKFLHTYNDGLEYNFQEISDLIEKHL